MADGTWIASASEILASATGFLNSGFVTSTLSLVGVVVGARLAASFSDRSKAIEEIGKEMRATQVAISLAHVSCNAAINLKQQHLSEMVRAYRDDRARCEAHRADVAAGKKREPLEIALDLRNLPPLNAPVKELQAVCHERTTLIGRPLAMALVLADTVSQIERLIGARNSLVDGFKAREMSEVAIAMYFGFPIETGHGRIFNQEYFDTVMGLSTQLDNMLFFCRELNDELATHANRLKSEWAKITSRKAPPVGRVDYSAVAPGVFPDNKDYPGWLGWQDPNQALPRPKSLAGRALSWLPRRLGRGAWPRPD